MHVNFVSHDIANAPEPNMYKLILSHFLPEIGLETLLFMHPSSQILLPLAKFYCTNFYKTLQITLTLEFQGDR